MWKSIDSSYWCSLSTLRLSLGMIVINKYNGDTREDGCFLIHSFFLIFLDGSCAKSRDRFFENLKWPFRTYNPTNGDCDCPLIWLMNEKPIIKSPQRGRLADIKDFFAGNTCGSVKLKTRQICIFLFLGVYFVKHKKATTGKPWN